MLMILYCLTQLVWAVENNNKYMCEQFGIDFRVTFDDKKHNVYV